MKMGKREKVGSVVINASFSLLAFSTVPFTFSDMKGKSYQTEIMERLETGKSENVKKGESWFAGNQRTFFASNLFHFSPLVVAVLLVCGLLWPVNVSAQTDEENLVRVDASVAPDKVSPGAEIVLNLKLNLAA